MKNGEEPLIIVGRVGSSYGVKGWIKIQSFTDVDDNILEFNPWFISSDQTSWQEIKILEKRRHHNGIIVLFEGVKSPEEARQLAGKWIGIKRSQLPKLNSQEYYWSDLIGLTVINKEGDSLGVISQILETGSNDVLVVKGLKEHAIPYLPNQVILEVNLEKRIIYVDWEPL